MGDTNFTDFKGKFKGWSDVDLLNTIRKNKKIFRPGALNEMEVELSKRDVPTGKKSVSKNVNIEKEKDADTKLAGIKGFLLLFIVYILCLFIADIFLSVYTFKYSQSKLALISSGIQMLIAFSSLFICRLLVGKRDGAKRKTQYWLLVLFLFNVISFFTLPNDYYMIRILGLSSIIWYVYFQVSKRVSNTYKKKGNYLLANR